MVEGSSFRSFVPICQVFLYSLFPDFFGVVRYFFHVPFKFLDGLSSVSVSILNIVVALEITICVFNYHSLSSNNILTYRYIRKLTTV